jgi:hypothetical protein
MNFFVIIGAMKSGTSSLYHHIGTHPAIFASKIKEPSFFTAEAPPPEKAAAYYSLFKDAPREAWAFEASTNYTKYPSFAGVPKRIYEMFPEARLIYMLRHPVDRICSHYIQNISDGRERRSFEAAVLGNDPHYLNVSRYYLQLSQYLEFFPSDRILVLIFEEFLQNKLATLRRVFSFLSVDTNFVPPNLNEIKNASAEKTVAWPILEILKKVPFYDHIPRPLCSFLGKKLRHAAPSKSEILTPGFHDRIVELLAKDFDQLQAHLCKKITCWYWRPVTPTADQCVASAAEGMGL